MFASGTALRDQLSALANQADAELELAPVALMIAGLNHPLAEESDYLGHLDALADRLTETAAETAAERAAALAAVLTETYGYSAIDDDEATADADLIETIDTRRGYAEALGIVALEVLGRAGWQAHGLRYPTRFLVRLEDGDGHRIIVDPSNGWSPVHPHQMREWLKAQTGLAAELSFKDHDPLSNRSVLVRFQNVAKIRHLRSGRLDRALNVVETTLLFAPSTELLWREAGILHARLNHFAAAVSALEHFLSRCSDQSIRNRTQQMLAELRQHLH